MSTEDASQAMAGRRLDVRQLSVSFARPGAEEHVVVRDVSFSLDHGRCVALVGESGSGKSVTARALVGLAGRRSRVKADRLEMGGRDLLAFSDADWRHVRGKEIGFVLQDALVSLDGLRRVGAEIGEAPKLHGEGGSRRALADRVVGLLKLVGVSEPAVKARQLPHELSGGQRQRALIASSISLAPGILIADEPTTALDVTVQAQVLSVLEETKRRGAAILLISHDLSVVARMADEILVMRAGEVVEQGDARRVLGDPRHEYTRSLLDAVPSADTRGKRLVPSSIPRVFAAVPPSKPPADDTPLLKAEQLFKSFQGPDRQRRLAVRGVSFTLGRGEVLGVVGESGSGKSTLARLCMALEPADAGEATLFGQPWSALVERDRRDLRRHIGMIYQDPLSSFDPRWNVESILADAIGANADRRRRIVELLELVRLPRSTAGRRPIELSGGQRQRIAIARALATNPRLIICDEPVSALDVSIQAQVLDLLCDLKRQFGMSYLFISHDIGVIRHISDRVLVMKNGEVVESGAVDDVLGHPADDYTRTLVASVPASPRSLIAAA